MAVDRQGRIRHIQLGPMTEAFITRMLEKLL